METALVKKIFDVDQVRKDFPILSREVNGKPLVYFDNAATSQKPLSVINALDNYYKTCNSNIHRGVYLISAEASEAYDKAKDKVKEFIGAKDSSEIIFTRGTTEAINLAAYSYGRQSVTEGDEVIISTMEHHSNIVPWQVLCDEKKAKLKIIPITDSGEIIMDEYKKMLNEKVKLVSICHISNSIGTINPVKEIIKLAHEKNIPILVDGAQAVHHTKVDVQSLDADFYAFSAHKMYGPMGIGVLYGKAELLEQMPPYQTGGDMISSVSFEKTDYNEIPMKFEAGTPNVEGAIGLTEAIDYINSIGRDQIHEHEKEILEYATEEIEQIESVKIIGTARNKTGSLSFIVEGLSALDIGIMLDTFGVAVRTGHHCTEPLMRRFKIPGTVRASFAMYNTKEEIDVFTSALRKSINILK
ncbi:MAG: cysteine desulfurase [Chlorobi bacterium]|nr:cysteine desulfurase [Chlorobiota bacterium]MCI0716395.1 cysteine desulfurase [Chlorobiota bacterium]